MPARMLSLYFVPASCMRGPRLKRRGRLFLSNGTELPLVSLNVSGEVAALAHITLELNAARVRVVSTTRRPHARRK